MTSALELMPVDPTRAPLAGSECCSLSEGPVDVMQAQRIAGVLKALSDPMRLRLLSFITAEGCEPVALSDIAEKLDIGQPTVSHHMRKLVEAGLLSREQRGKQAFYTVIPAAFAELRTLLDIS